MGNHPSHVVQTLVSEEIRRIVAEAVGDGMCVSARASAAAIVRTYPNSGMDQAEIIAEIVSAASAAGVAVADDAAASGVREGGGGTEFGVLFAQSQDLYATLDEMVAGVDGPIDPAEVAGKLIEKIPSLEFTESELEIVVRNVATTAGRSVKHPEAAKRFSRYSQARRSRPSPSSELTK